MGIIFMESMWWRLGTLGAGALLTALVLAVGHWFPWVRKLPRVRAYVYGVVSIWLGFAVWRFLNGDWRSPVGLVIIASAGGATVIGAYWIDDIVVRVRQARKAEMVDDGLSIPE